ncbi:MAG TPA: MarR family winged helix-turn-helix transcriptional regulator [Thermoanaerobaculia bacterium]|nr:MarR family winged helix-turn-helix transcriptional regulator [Thermoanaerobaculia bacterium]
MTDSQRILDSVRRLVRLLRLSDRAAQTQVGLSAAQLFVLNELGKTPELSLNELAERTRTDQSSVSVVVTRLAEAGLIERRRAEDDARRLVLTLTRSGRVALVSAPPPPQSQLLDVIESLPPSERKRFANTFARLVDAMGAGSTAAPMLFEDEPKQKKRKARP